jgi:hypothetical protein
MVVMESRTALNGDISLTDYVTCPPDATLVIEQIQSMGMRSTGSVQHCLVGRPFLRGVAERATLPVAAETDQLHLCGNMQAKDSNVRQALRSIVRRFRCDRRQGRKGPLYWAQGPRVAALAVAVTWIEREPTTERTRAEKTGRDLLQGPTCNGRSATDLEASMITQLPNITAEMRDEAPRSSPAAPSRSNSPSRRTRLPASRSARMTLFSGSKCDCLCGWSRVYGTGRR